MAVFMPNAGGVGHDPIPLRKLHFLHFACYACPGIIDENMPGPKTRHCRGDRLLPIRFTCDVQTDKTCRTSGRCDVGSDLMPFCL